jgi:uncharacterized protein YndB with AHSA1/START domain
MKELRIEDEIVVEAPPAMVWDAIADPVAHAAWHPFVTQIAGEHRLGAARTCSVIAGKKSGETRERCVEADAGRAITWSIDHDTTGFSRLVVRWRSGFDLQQHDRGTLVRARSAFEPRNILVRAIMPPIARKFHQVQREILTALKGSVERQAP